MIKNEAVVVLKYLNAIGKAVSPDFWHQMYITDYPNHKDEFK